MDKKEITILESLPLIKDFHDLKKREQLLDLLYIHDPVIRVWALSQYLAKNNFRLSKDGFEIAMHISRRSGHVRKIFIDYLKKEINVGYVLPKEIEIRILTAKNNVFIRLEYDRIEINQPLEIYFTIPENYEHCQ